MDEAARLRELTNYAVRDNSAAEGRTDIQDDEPPFPKTTTIRAKLATVVLSCIIPSLCGLGLLILYFYDLERAHLEGDALQTARALTAAVDRELEIAEKAALALGSSPNLASGDLAAFHRQATSLVKESFPGANFLVTDKTGQILSSTLRPYGEPLPRKGNSDQLRQVFETGKPLISDLYIGTMYHRPLVSIDVPVWRDGTVAYALGVVFLPEQLSRILTAQRVPAGRVITIHDSRGIIAARTQLADKFVGQPAPAALAQRMQEAPEGIVETESMEGVRVLVAFNRSSVTGWTVAIVIPKAEILRELLQSTWPVTLAVALLLAAGFTTAWVMGGRIGRSVQALTVPALALGAGKPVIVPAGGFKEAMEVGLALQTVERELKAHRHHFAAEQALRERQQLFEQMFISGSAIKLLIDPADARIIDANPAAANFYGYSLGQLRQMTAFDINPGPQSEIESNLARIRDADQGYFVLQHRLADGSLRWVESYASPIRLQDRTLFLAIIHDITDRKWAEQAERDRTEELQATQRELKRQGELLRQLALTDSLTGVANRRCFDETLDKEWRRCERSDQSIAVIMVDVDHFKAFNDLYGHQAGDACLTAIAGALDECVRRPPDMVARYGGEEFIVLLPQESLKGAIAVAERMLAGVRALSIPHARSSCSPHVTISLGIAAMVPTRQDAPASLLAAADAGLYGAKAAGRNRHCSVDRDGGPADP